MMIPDRKRIFDHFKRAFIPAYEEESVIDRVESLKKEIINDYEVIKKKEKETLLEAAEMTDSEEDTKTLHNLADQADCQAKEARKVLSASDEYLGSVADIIRRK